MRGGGGVVDCGRDWPERLRGVGASQTGWDSGRRTTTRDAGCSVPSNTQGRPRNTTPDAREGAHLHIATRASRPLVGTALTVQGIGSRDRSSARRHLAAGAAGLKFEFGSRLSPPPAAAAPVTSTVSGARIAHWARRGGATLSVGRAGVLCCYLRTVPFAVRLPSVAILRTFSLAWRLAPRQRPWRIARVGGAY